MVVIIMIMSILLIIIIIMMIIIIIINPIMNKENKDIEIKQAKIFKQIIMTPQHYPPTFLPCFLILNPPEKQLYK